MKRLISVFGLSVTILGLGLLASPFVFADSEIGAGNPPKYWAISTSVARSNSLYVTNDGNEISSVDLTIAPMIILSPNYNMSILIESSQDLKVEEWDFGRGILGFKKYSGYELFVKRVKMTPGLSFGFPLSKAAKASSLNVATTGSLRFDVNPDFLVSKKLSLATSVSLTRNFHQYDTSLEGKVNTKYSSAQGFEIGWAFDSRYSLSANLTHIDTVSYQGVARDYLSHGQEFGVQMNPRLSLAMGHAWGAPYVATRKANGQDLNFELIDDRNSLVYVQLGFLL